jgi:diphthine-ammonia ligase
MTAVCSSSGGKDSMLALWYAKQQGIQPLTLLTMFDETGLRSRSHGVPRAIVERQARALGLQLLAPSAGWTDYESVFVGALRNLRASGHEIAICVDSRHLGDEFCGRLFDESFIADLPAGVDACGENRRVSHLCV